MLTPPTGAVSCASVAAHRVAVIGGGVTGAYIASTLATNSAIRSVDVFDQGRSGVGGRTSHRSLQLEAVVSNSTATAGNIEATKNYTLRWDHGCQVRVLSFRYAISHSLHVLTKIAWLYLIVLQSRHREVS